MNKLGSAGRAHIHHLLFGGQSIRAATCLAGASKNSISTGDAAMLEWNVTAFDLRTPGAHRGRPHRRLGEK